jgi:hypothetical protein
MTYEEAWLHTRGANGARSFYKREGNVLIYRYGDIFDTANETEFQRCE